MIPSFYKEHGFHEIYQNCIANFHMGLSEDLRLVLVDTFYGRERIEKLYTNVVERHKAKNSYERAIILDLKKEWVPSSLREHMRVAFGLEPQKETNLRFTITQYRPRIIYTPICDHRMTTIDFVLTSFAMNFVFYTDDENEIDRFVAVKNDCLLFNKSVWRKERNMGAEDVLVLSVACDLLRQDNYKKSFVKTKELIEDRKRGTGLVWEHIGLSW